jgi:hypothetical protein
LSRKECSLKGMWGPNSASGQSSLAMPAAGACEEGGRGRGVSGVTYGLSVNDRKRGGRGRMWAWVWGHGRGGKGVVDGGGTCVVGGEGDGVTA